MLDHIRKISLQIGQVKETARVISSDLPPYKDDQGRTRGGHPGGWLQNSLINIESVESFTVTADLDIISILIHNNTSKSFV